jgi:hypothetical protein
VLAVSGGGGGGQDVGDDGSGEFADAALGLGLRTGEVDVEPAGARARGGLWVVLERVGPSGSVTGGGEDVQVEVLSDGMVRLGGWEPADEIEF